MLRSGGRAAIVLPQGKFNNSSLAFIREWILRKARLLAVVGLHGNTFKPHTGTKTSVLFIQKYTDEQLENIKKIQKEVESNCPDYEKQVRDILDKYQTEIDIPEEEITEKIFELLIEEYPEPEIEEDATENEDEDNEPLTLEEKLDLLEDKITELKNNRLKAKENLDGLKDEVEAMQNKQKDEISIAKENWEGTVKNFNVDIKPIKEQNKVALKTLRDSQKEKAKQFKVEIKSYDKAIPLTEEEKLLLTNKGKLQLLLNDEDSIEKLRNRYIDAEVAKQLDYPIFMAVSERGGKNNSGDYEYMLDDDGNLIEDAFGNPEINQDLVNHNITRDDLLTRAEELTEDELCIAEAFVQFAKQQGFDFWKN